MATVIFYLFLLSIIISIVFWTLKNGISPMPTSRKVKKLLFKILPEDIQGPIIDLGSGFGTLVIPLSSRYPDCQIIGYETSTIPFLVSYLRKIISGKKNIQLISQNFFSVSLKNAKIIICYLFPEAMIQIKSKLEQELQEGAWVICHTFAIPGWQHVKVYYVNDLYKTPIYLYRKGYNSTPPQNFKRPNY